MNRCGNSHFTENFWLAYQQARDVIDIRPEAYNDFLKLAMQSNGIDIEKNRVNSFLEKCKELVHTEIFTLTSTLSLILLISFG